MDDDDVISIYSMPVRSFERCMGYPISKAGHALAEWVFETPEVLKVPDAVPWVYLCQECWTAFMSEIAIGFVWQA
jgi:hypothetical protein